MVSDRTPTLNPIRFPSPDDNGTIPRGRIDFDVAVKGRRANPVTVFLLSVYKLNICSSETTVRGTESDVGEGKGRLYPIFNLSGDLFLSHFLFICYVWVSAACG